MVLVCVVVSSDPSQPSVSGFFRAPSAQGYGLNNPDQVKRTASLVENIIVGCGLPLSIVENPHFIAFCKDMDPMFHLPSRSHLSQQLLPNAVSRKVLAVQNKLESAQSLSLTLDIWTDRRCHSFLAATVHSFVHCQPHSMLLSFVSFKGSHTGIRIAAEIERIMEQNKLTDRVVYLVTDNASNMKKAVDVFKAFHVQDEEEGENASENDDADQLSSLDDDTVWQDLDEDDDHLVEQAMTKCSTSRLACFAHTLQLTVRDGLEKLNSSKGQNMKTVVGKCVKLANLCHQSAQFWEAFEEKLGAGHSIPTANTTRWSSTYTQLQAVARLDRNQLESVLRATGQGHLMITVRESAMLKELVEILEPFAEATEITQGEKYSTIGCVVPCIIGLYNCLSRFLQSSKYHGPLVRELMESLQTRFGGLLTNVGILDEPQNDNFVDLVYPMASLLDPNYGFVWLEDDLPVSVGVKDAVQQRLVDSIITEAQAVCHPEGELRLSC